MLQQKTDSRLARREFLNWLCKIGGSVPVITLTADLLPLKRINKTLFSSEAHAQEPFVPCEQDFCTDDFCTDDCPTDSCTDDSCTDDSCTERDACESGDAGHTCQQQDVCTVDESGDCTGDRCVSDKSLECTNDGGPLCPEDDTCSEDMCSDDFGGPCVSDASGNCTNDSCYGDASGACQTDRCRSDSSGGCQTDTCVADKSGECTNDDCASDSSGGCETDTCTSDKSGECTNDNCASDSSKACQTDICLSDSSGECKNDDCTSDSSGGCETDTCPSDSSGACTNDNCASDSSGGCETDTCASDSSGECKNDECIADSSGDCAAHDRCNSDYSGVCNQMDVCVLDLSADCDSDLCRDDKTPPGSECTNSDTCSLDLTLNSLTNRRQFAQTGLNKAIRLLYKLTVVVLFIGLACGQSEAATVIDAANAVLSHTPAYTTSGSVTVATPVGPFLRDCDDDGILEADVNGDGQCAGDPEVRDYNGDGTRELPDGILFTGDFEFTCFHIPDDVAIVATGPLTIKASREVSIFGAMRLGSGAEISCQGVIDLRTSAWLSEDGSAITFTTALSGEVDETQTTYADDENVPPINYTSICQQSQGAIPTLTGWGTVFFSLLMAGLALGVIRRRKTAT